jgi:MFS family permease
MAIAKLPGRSGANTPGRAGHWRIFVSGILLGFLGAILPSWGHHLQPDYWMVGLYFVALILGVLASVRLARPLMEKLGLGRTLSLACALASVALFDLAFFSPPYIAWWRLPAIFFLGAAAGLLHTNLHAISPMYRLIRRPQSIWGILFGWLLQRRAGISQALFLAAPSRSGSADSELLRRGLRTNAFRSQIRPLIRRRARVWRKSKSRRGAFSRSIFQLVTNGRSRWLPLF